MAFLADSVLDAALTEVSSNAVALHICTQAPSSYAQATSTHSVGSKSGLSFSAASNASPNGRKMSTSVSNGSVSGNGDATHWAIVSGSELLAYGELTANQIVTSGNKFNLPGVEIIMPDAA
ncbi:hypothetical protein ACQU0X_01080 [Pseudovibrio ascidiaceicola]|uniref:hypothetical protein n=1 Tax=Pseudovibrio ascidiaceicola TaxID=285279 RepID=UPI003D35B1A7